MIPCDCGEEHYAEIEKYTCACGTYVASVKLKCNVCKVVFTRYLLHEHYGGCDKSSRPLGIVSSVSPPAFVINADGEKMRFYIVEVKMTPFSDDL